MPGWIAEVSLVSGAVPVTVPALALAAIVVVVARRGPWRWPVLAIAAATLGAGVGLVLSWLLSDVLRVLEVSLSPVSRAWVAATFAAVAVLVVGLVRGGARRRVAAAAGILVALLAGTLGVNADFGQYVTVGSLTGVVAGPRLVVPPRSTSSPSATPSATPTPPPTAPVDGAATDLSGTTAPAGQPARGRLGTVVIPGTLSRFPARPAYVYLPPRALVPHAPRLPVLILLSGQPGGPDSMVNAGQVEPILNAYAAAHAGLAPIVVIPDQLSAPQVNPMCLDSPLGNSATYLTRDVPAWILANLNVQTQRGAWAIGGFSQGGTCTIQLGSAHPELFTALLDIAGQEAPFRGSVAETIRVGFGGSAAAYRAALPASLLAARAPYRDTVAIFTSGQADARYGPVADRMAARAAAAGMRTTRLISPGTAHDWATARWSLQRGLPLLGAHLGLQR